MSCPALSARRPAAWIAGPSAIGSVNGMPSSITSAPAAGNAFVIASDVSYSGSPAIRKVTSAARPSSLSAAKRLSIRVVISARRLRAAKNLELQAVGTFHSISLDRLRARRAIARCNRAADAHLDAAVGLDCKTALFNDADRLAIAKTCRLTALDLRRDIELAN